MEISNDVPDCCGSGCTNCVLDLKPSHHKLPIGVTNIFDRTYQRFVCSSISQQTEFVFRFSLRLEKSPHDHADRMVRRLMVPSGCHLLLRAPKTHNLSQFPAHDQLEAWRNQHPAGPIANCASMKASEKYDKNEDDLYYSRPYTPVRCDHEESTFDVLIKMEPGGKMTEYLSTISIGSLTEWKGVYGDFEWIRNQYQNVIGFVQGVAIAPVYSTMKAILDDEEDCTRLTLCACFRDIHNVLLREELHSMARYWNFKYETYLSRRSCTCVQDLEHRCACLTKRRKYNEPIYDRRMEAKDIERLVAPFSEGKNSLLVLLCGTDSFTTFITSNLVKLRIENYHMF